MTCRLVWDHSILYLHYIEALLMPINYTQQQLQTTEIYISDVVIFVQSLSMVFAVNSDVHTNLYQ